MAKQHTLDFVLESLYQALHINRQYPAQPFIPTRVGNTSILPEKALEKQGIFQSISWKGTYADSAAMENFFGLLKQEMYYGEALVSYEELRQRIEQNIT